MIYSTHVTSTGLRVYNRSQVKMKNTEGFPLYVKIGLLAIYSKRTALFYFWLSIALSVVSAVLGVFNRIYFWGLGFLISALWYWLCIRWVDKNSKWDK